MKKTLIFFNSERKKKFLTLTLQDFYFKEVIPFYLKLGKNRYQIPFIEKIVLSSCNGKFVNDLIILSNISRVLSIIAQQKALVVKTKIAVSSFKVRRGLPIGVKITLRKKRKFIFLEKILKIILPLTRDFSGLKLSSFNTKGNFAFGIKNCSVFREVNLDTLKFNFGFDVHIVIKSFSKQESMQLLRYLYFPFKEKKKVKVIV